MLIITCWPTSSLGAIQNNSGSLNEPLEAKVRAAEHFSCLLLLLVVRVRRVHVLIVPLIHTQMQSSFCSSSGVDAIAADPCLEKAPAWSILMNSPPTTLESHEPTGLLNECTFARGKARDPLFPPPWASYLSSDFFHS